MSSKQSAGDTKKARAAKEAAEQFREQGEKIQHQASRWGWKAQAALQLWTVGWGMVLLFAPAALLFQSGRSFPKSPAPGMIAMTAICLGAIGVSSATFRLLFPSVPILAKDVNNQPYESHRTMKQRWLIFGATLGAYLLGVAILYTNAQTPTS
ncbi:MAG: hypothetical protein JNK05_03075 [Myxococcales bacterium]|nr:hypothetical protein [Myxococcales bacterium]